MNVKKDAFSIGLIPDAFHCYYNGGGIFVDADTYAEKGVEVLASYSASIDVEGGSAAIIYRRVGDGNVLLTGTHPE